MDLTWPTPAPPAAPLQAGAQETFWVLDGTGTYFQVEATLQAVTDEAYIWVDDREPSDPAGVEALASAFSQIYAANRKIFGSEWSPGIDGDPHVYILFARGVGADTDGYFYSVNESPPTVHEYSNAHEMFILNADNLYLASEDTYSVLAHELQHMIHWRVDSNEDAWLDEGLAELAQLLNDLPSSGHEFDYANMPDLQLNTWSDEEADVYRHYGAAFLFMAYLQSRLGWEAIQMVAAQPANGLASIDRVLEKLGSHDPQTAEDLFVDWAIANWLNDSAVADGRFAYRGYTDIPRARPTLLLSQCFARSREFDVQQYGVDYVHVVCPGRYTLHFAGASEATLLPVAAHSGDYAFWSNQGDMSDTTLTRAFDLRGRSGPLTLTYWVWYDIEGGYDYAYLEASADGRNWTILTTPSGSDHNPVGNSYGWGYTGESSRGGWVQEWVDISQYAGQELQLRFEYVTDDAVHGAGLLLDDIEVPEIGYYEDLEDGDGGWQGQGFVRVTNVLPQTFRLALVTEVGGQTAVQFIPLGKDNRTSIELHIPAGGRGVTLLVAGTTRFTRQPATYTLAFEEH